jgi:hypothetical protein
MSGSHGFIGSVLTSLFVRSSGLRPEVAALHNWWCSAKEDQTARELETRLFFDPALLRDARQSRRSGKWKRAVAGAVIGMAVWVVPSSLIHAGEHPTVEEDGATDDPHMEVAIWEWLLDIVMQTTSSDRDEGNSGDPDGE